MALSDILTTNTGAPQGCVLLPVLFTLYTTDCRSEDGENLLVKFADDTSLSGLLEENEVVYGEAVTKLVNWCDSNFLGLNISKIKEKIVDYRRKKDITEPPVITGEMVEIVESYQYLGTIIDSKLDRTANIDTCCKRAHQRLHFLQKLGSFLVNENILLLFYQSVVRNILLYNHYVTTTTSTGLTLRNVNESQGQRRRSSAINTWNLRPSCTRPLLCRS